MKKSLLLVSAFALLFGVTQQANAAGSTGSNGGYYWTLYYEGPTCSISFPSGSGNFKITWPSGISDCIGGKGWSTGSTRTINYNLGSISGYHSFGAYGWTTSPLIEYYVTELGSNGGTKVNTVSSDGHTYTFYKQQRVNAPSIQGTKTFWQYKDSWGGSSTGSNRKITMSTHINNWKSKGGQGFGSYNVQILFCEAFSGPGSVNATVW